MKNNDVDKELLESVLKENLILRTIFAITAHDFGGPLAAIHTNATLIDKYGLSLQETIECAQDILTSSEKLEQLHNTTTNLDETKAEKDKLEKELTENKDLLEEGMVMVQN